MFASRRGILSSRGVLSEVRGRKCVPLVPRDFTQRHLHAYLQRIVRGEKPRRIYCMRRELFATTTSSSSTSVISESLRAAANLIDKAGIGARLFGGKKWYQKIPKGFKNFYPGKGGGKKAGADGAASSSAAKKKTSGPKGSSSKGATDKSTGSKDSKPKLGGDSGGDGGGGMPGGDPNNLMGNVQVTAAMLALWAAYELYSANKEDNATEISWQEFKNSYLAAGRVERIVVVNKTIARVTLRSEDADDGAWEPTRDSRGRSSGRSRAEREVFFSIGSVDNFERKLEYAQRDLGIASREFIPVQYVTATDWKSVLMRLSPTLLLVGLWILMMRGMSGGLGGMGGGGGGGPMGGIFKIGKAKPATKVTSDVTFKDVAGCDEAKAEIMEFVQFLKKPDRFVRLGAKIPKGALLVGPPGTGKTLLAKATAGEASVPFFSMSGSDFIEMFVGVGPSRVRDLFKKARDAAPCIVFIDEIDAVARARSKGGFSGGNDERENTLNQLLVEMDGFSTKSGVVVLAGTNRADILDPAILRPGRFDRQIMVDKPDIKGRKDIFLVYLKDLTVKGDLDDLAERLAALTPGFAGAEICNICNEAAIIAARADKSEIELVDFEGAVDRVIGGLEKKNRVMSLEERRTVAYHEAGHAIVGWLLEHADPLLKVTIIPRGNGALGFAQYLPKEVALHTEQQLLDRMCMALGGRACEDIKFDGVVTTGASDDLKRVTQIAQSMVSVFGMNKRVGNVSFQRESEYEAKPYSESTAQIIDEEVRELIDDMYARTKTLLEQNMDKVSTLAEHLLEKETVNVDDVVELIGPRPFPMPRTYADFMASSFEESEKEGLEDEPAVGLSDEDEADAATNLGDGPAPTAASVKSDL